MNTRETTLAIAAAVTTAVLFMGAPANAQPPAPPPPAQGPAPASPNASGIEVASYTSILDSTINQQIATKNQELSAIWKGGSLKLSTDTLLPRVTSTINYDRPNEFYVDIPHNLAYTYTIAGYSLTISQQADIQVSCEGWQNGSGVLTVNAVLQRSFFDPSQFSVIMDALQIPSQAASKIESELAPIDGGIPFGTFPIPAGQACSTLGATTQAQGGARVLFDTPSAASHPALPVGETTTMSVRVVSVTRISIFGFDLYQPMETSHLNLWASYSNLQLDLPPMVQGQTYVPTTNAVVQTAVPSANGELVVIASMTYDNLAQEDSTYAVFGRNANSGAGTRNLVSRRRCPISPSATPRRGLG